MADLDDCRRMVCGQRFLQRLYRNRWILACVSWPMFVLFLYAFGTLVVYLLSTHQTGTYWGSLLKPKDFSFLYAVLEVLVRIGIGCLSSIFLLLFGTLVEHSCSSLRDLFR